MHSILEIWRYMSLQMILVLEEVVGYPLLKWITVTRKMTNGTTIEALEMSEGDMPYYCAMHHSATLQTLPISTYCQIRPLLQPPILAAATSVILAGQYIYFGATCISMYVDLY